jgi:hypothetical protein
MHFESEHYLSGLPTFMKDWLKGPNVGRIPDFRPKLNDWMTRDRFAEDDATFPRELISAARDC